MPVFKSKEGFLKSSTVPYITPFDNTYQEEVIGTPAGQISYENPFPGIAVAVTSAFGKRKLLGDQWPEALKQCHWHFAVDIGGTGFNTFKAPEKGRASMVLNQTIPDGCWGAPLGDDHATPIVKLEAVSGNTHYFVHCDGSIVGSGKDVEAGQNWCKGAPWYGGPHVHWVFTKKGSNTPLDVFKYFIDDPQVKSTSPAMKALADVLRPSYQQAVAALNCPQV
jgi:hypothetical protein